MRQQLVSLLLLLSLASLPSAPHSSAQDPASTPALDRQPLPLAGASLAPEHLPQGPPAAGAGQGDGLVTVLLQLEDEPVIAAWHRAQAGQGKLAAAALARTQARTINAAQTQLLPAIEHGGGRVLYRLQRTLNGVVAQVPLAQVARLRQLPGVVDVQRLLPRRLANASAVALLGAPQLWGASAGLGLSGAGIKVGVIDSGIDYLHTAFGGSGLAADYARNSTTVISDSVGFPSAKLAGGYDFVGDSYDAGSQDATKRVPQPDPDPMDCMGHGTHVAATLGGYGVNADGTTYTGPYTRSMDLQRMRIGPGVAPLVELYSLRVFGCSGSSELIEPAIEWATDPNQDYDFSDHLDVINMSLGSDYGGPNDPMSQAINRAALAGVLVVAAAGNGGDSYYISGAPGSADWAISVAASVDSTDTFDGLLVNQPASLAGLYPASNGTSYDWSKGGVNGRLVYPPTQRSGCQAFDAGNAALLQGAIALLDWTDGECSSAQRSANAEAAGAVGMVLVDTTTTIGTAIAGSPTIPSTIISQSSGAQIKAALGAGSQVNVTLSNQHQVPVVDQSRVDEIASFSSRGPRRVDSALKPDLSAPGYTVFSARALSGSQGMSLNGTSMASPLVAGAMALLRQLHPDWTVEELKALLINTASAQTRTAGQSGAPFAPSRQGAGRALLEQAGVSQVVAYNAAQPGLVSVSFGAPEVLGSASYIRNVRVVNRGAHDASYAVQVSTTVSSAGVSVTPLASQVSVPAGGSANVALLVTVDAAALDRTLDPATAATQGGLARHFLNEHAGQLQLVPQQPRYTALLSGERELPPVATNAAGQASISYRPAANELSYSIRLSSLSGVSAVHIHRGAADVNGPVAYTLCDAASGTACSDSALSGSLGLSEADEALLASGGLYINVHTSTHAAGAIRGQLVPLPTLQLPFSIAPRPASHMRAASPLRYAAGQQSGSLLLQGQALASSASYSGLAWVLQLQEQNVDDAFTSGPADAGDLKYIGIGRDISATGTITPGTMLYFGLATYGQRNTPNEVQFEVHIDTTADNRADFVVFNSNAGWLSGGDATDVYASVVYNLATSQVVNAYLLNAMPASVESGLLNSSVMVLPVPAGDLGLRDGQSRFSYQVVAAHGDQATASNSYNALTDMSNVHSYDPAAPALAAQSPGIGGAPVYADRPDTGVSVQLNRGTWYLDRPAGLLVLHLLNVPGAKAEAVEVQVTGLHQLFLPLSRR